jgi:uncharacterized protein YlxW (UPF0749 family)
MNLLVPGPSYDNYMRSGRPHFVTAAAVGLVGFLAVVAASGSVPARSLRRLELVDLILEQDARVRGLRAEVRGLRADVARVRPTGLRAGAILARARELSVLAGGAALVGPGVVVVLDDSSASRSPSGDPNDLIVHEEDIQAVVNALWAAGAEALAVNGERLTSVSAVRCAGNTLLLHGAVRSPPYEIGAIGDPEELQGELLAQPGMDRLLSDAQTFGIVLEIRQGSIRIPERTVIAPIRSARPA